MLNLICDAGYLEEGFLALQQAVDYGLMEFLSASATSKLREVKVRLQRFPFPPYVNDSFVIVVQQWLPFVVLLSSIFSAMQIVRDLVYEKERRLKVLTTNVVCSRHLTVVKIHINPQCRECGEEEETLYHFLGKCYDHMLVSTPL